ncbi:hypothetical protein L7F22_014483 [Adiantum nelumboides]|nr:hypothetical protein [Adiantum nelumboides]
MQSVKPGTMWAEEWEEVDELARSTIMLSVSDNLLFNVENEETAWGMWKRLENLYAQQSAASKVYWLKNLMDLRMKEVTKIKLALEKTQSKQKKAANRHCRDLVFSLGDWVLLRFEKARLRKMKGKERLFPKLGMRYYGPFKVCDKISDVAYRLKLPEGRKIHNAFHVSLLRPFVGDVPEDMVPEEQPEVEELDEILVPEQILAHKDRKVRGKVARRYLVKFKNYSPMDAKWM